MSDEQTAVEQQAPVRTAPGGMRPWVWIFGGVMWLLVGTGLVVIWGGLLRKPETPAGQSPVVVTPDGSPAEGAAGTTAQDSSETAETDDSDKPQPLFDPEGLADFSLTERSGETITNEDLRGQPWVVSFIFTRCAGPCLAITGQISMLQQKFAEQPVRFVSITVDPDYDTPEVLQRYASAFNAPEDQWLFLTGDQKKIYELIIRSFRMPVQEMTGDQRKPGFEVAHSTNLLLVNAEGVVVDKFNAQSDTDVIKLRKAITGMLEDAPGETSGNPSDTETTDEAAGTATADDPAPPALPEN